MNPKTGQKGCDSSLVPLSVGSALPGYSSTLWRFGNFATRVTVRVRQAAGRRHAAEARSEYGKTLIIVINV